MKNDQQTFTLMDYKRIKNERGIVCVCECGKREEIDTNKVSVDRYCLIDIEKNEFATK